MHARRSLMSLAFAALLASIAPNPALGAPSPKEKADARALVTDAKKALSEKRFAEAMSALEQANKLDPAPEIEMDLAEVEIASGELIAASKRLTALATTDDGTPAGKKAREAAKKALADLMTKIPSVKITVKGPLSGAKVRIDGADVSLGSDESVDPGEHTISASAEGFSPSEQKVKLAEGARQAVELTLEPASAGEENSGLGSRLPGIIVGGAGGLSLVIGVIVGGAAIAATSSAKSGPGCANNVCPNTPEVNDRINKAKALGDVSTGLLVGGGVAAAAGAVLFFVLPRADKGAESAKVGRVVPWIGADRVGIAGTF